MKPYIKATIEHWEDRMIPWVETQDPDDKPDALKMYKAIGENWHGEYCPLCIEFYYGNCMGCSLFLAVGKCGDPENENENLWDCVNDSKTWKKWLFYAKKFVKQIKEAGK